MLVPYFGVMDVASSVIITSTKIIHLCHSYRNIWVSICAAAAAAADGRQIRYISRLPAATSNVNINPAKIYIQAYNLRIKKNTSQYFTSQVIFIWDFFICNWFYISNSLYIYLKRM